MKVLQRLPRHPPSQEVVDDLVHLFGSSTQSTRMPNEAARLSLRFEEFYHHAAPFDPDSLLGIWSACREQPADEEACRTLAAQSASAAASATEDRSEELALCLQGGAIGARCDEGLRQARVLLETGALDTGGLPFRSPRR